MSEKVQVNVRGTIQYPKYEDGKFTATLFVDNPDLTNKRLIEGSKELNSKLNPVVCRVNDEGQSTINIKSNYDLTIIDTEGNKLDTKLLRGAKVAVKLNLSEYKYNGKKGITTYIQAVLLEEQGEEFHYSAEDFD